MIAPDIITLRNIVVGLRHSMCMNDERFVTKVEVGLMGCNITLVP